jgi:hypothetical protein
MNTAEDFLIYLLKVSAVTAIFYLTYHLLFKESKHFIFNRIYLAGSFLFSFIVPMLSFNTPYYTIQANTYLPNGIIENITKLSENKDIGVFLGPIEILLIIYSIGFLNFLIKLGFAYKTAANVKSKCEKYHMDDLKVYVSNESINPFTFLNNIVIGKNILNHNSLEMILSHESVHANEKHFYDILLAEILFSLQWFNPLAWFYCKAIRRNLEFRVDDVVLKTSDMQEYQMIMLSMVLNRAKPSLFAELNSTNLKNRIIMMKSKNKNKFNGIARLAIIPVVALVLFSFSGRETVMVNENQGGGASSINQSLAADKVKDLEVKSIDDFRKFLAKNLRYPEDAATAGKAGHVKLYAKVSDKGLIEDVVEVQPKSDFTNIDEVVVTAYGKSIDKNEDSFIDESLKKEVQRLIKSSPKLEVPELFGKWIRVNIVFVLQ